MKAYMHMHTCPGILHTHAYPCIYAHTRISKFSAHTYVPVNLKIRAGAEDFFVYINNLFIYT